MSKLADDLAAKLRANLDAGAFDEVRAFPSPGKNAFGQPSGFHPEKGPHGPKHRTLRWGSQQAYSFNGDAFVYQGTPSPPAPSPFLYFTSTLLAATKLGRPLLWKVHAQFLFNLDAAWLGDANAWFFVVTVQPGVGQANNPVQKVTQYTPSAGTGIAYDTIPSQQGAFALANAYFPLDLEFELPGQNVYVNTQIYGPAPTFLTPGSPPPFYTGAVSAWAAPWFMHPEETTE